MKRRCIASIRGENPRGIRLASRALALGILVCALTGCPPSPPALDIAEPAERAEFASASVFARVRLGEGVAPASFRATLDKSDVTAAFTVGAGEATATLAAAPYWNLLEVSASRSGTPVSARRAFRVAPAQPGWHPEIAERPRLAYRASEFPAILARLGREPYSTLYARVLAVANQTPGAGTPGEYVPAEEYPRANVVKSAAFVCAVQGGAFCAKARDLLLTMKTDFGLLNLLNIGDNPHGGSAILSYLGGYDILAGTGTLAPAQDAQIRANLGALVASYYALYVENVAVFLAGQQSNHNIINASAAGAAAIVLNQDPRAPTWADYGRSEVDYHLRNLIGTDGGYAEGPYYFFYSSIHHLPFLLAMRDFLGGAGAAHPVECRTRALGVPCASTVEWVPDALSDPFLKKAYDWTLALRMPGGGRPPYDDAFLHGPLTGLLANAFADPVYAWDWRTATEFPLVSNWTFDFTVETIARYDDGLAAAPPPFSPTAILPEAGAAVFRSGWGDGETYFLLLAERGKMRDAGHEHTDATSFLLARGREHLALDPGYIRFDQNGLVNKASNHNLILVDGEGAPNPAPLNTPDVDAFLENAFDADFLDYAEARATYRGATVRRRVAFENETFFVISDRVESAASHVYTWQLHGHGGGDSGGDFAMRADGAEWSRPSGAPTAKLRVHLTSDAGAPAFRHELDNQGLTYLDLRRHETLRADVTAANATFLAVLLPADAAAAFPTVTQIIPGAFRIEDGGDRVLAGTGSAAAPLALPGALTGLGDAASDGRLALLRADAGTAAARHALLADGTYLDHAGVRLLALGARGTVAARFGAAEIVGSATGVGATTVRIALASAPASVSGAAVTGHSHAAGVLAIQVSGPTDFRVVR